MIAATPAGISQLKLTLNFCNETKAQTINTAFGQSAV